MPLLGADAADEGADQCPVGDVEVLERWRVGFGRVLPVVPQQGGGGGGGAEPFEVHREERHVEQHVADPQPLVEVETVEDAGAVVEAEDVVGEQVAVSIDDVAPGHAVGEQRAASAQVA